MYVETRVKHIAVLLTLLVATAFLASCDQDGEFEPEHVVEGGPGYEVSRLDPSVWATTDISQPKILLPLNDSSWHDLEGERMVTTDDGGQAEVRGPSCTAVYVYQNSGLTMSACPKGGGTGSCSTGTIISTNCDVSIRTIPADVEIEGTWFSVTYLEEARVTLVIVGEGLVKVTPATALDFQLVDRAQLLYEVITRDFGEPVQVEVAMGEEARFLYTASDDRLTELKEFGDLPSARTWLDTQELQSLRDVLSPLDPLLGPWLEQILEQARQDGIQLSTTRTEQITPTPSIPSSTPPLTMVSIVDGEAQPNLATAWQVSEDGLSWTFLLDEGRETSDGGAYTSDIIEQILNEEGFILIKGYAGSEILDDFTIILILEQASPDFLGELAQIEFPQ